MFTHTLDIIHSNISRYNNIFSVTKSYSIFANKWIRYNNMIPTTISEALTKHIVIAEPYYTVFSNNTSRTLPYYQLYAPGVHDGPLLPAGGGAGRGDGGRRHVAVAGGADGRRGS